MITLEDAKRIVHGRDLSARDQLVVIMAVDPVAPLTTDCIKTRCMNIGLRKLAKRNISDVLSKSSGYFARTSAGWELQATAQHRLVSLGEIPNRQIQKIDDLLLAICDRFHRAVVPLTERRRGKSVIDFSDEYDVQDVFGVLLRCAYEDVRAEEWTPSYSGTSARIDFVIKDTKTAAELKRARPQQKIGNELILDIARYAKHPDVENLVCFVYDPDSVLRGDAAQIEKDLSGRRIQDGRALDVTVLVRPR